MDKSSSKGRFVLILSYFVLHFLYILPRVDPILIDLTNLFCIEFLQFEILSIDFIPFCHFSTEENSKSKPRIIVKLEDWNEFQERYAREQLEKKQNDQREKEKDARIDGNHSAKKWATPHIFRELSIVKVIFFLVWLKI